MNNIYKALSLIWKGKESHNLRVFFKSEIKREKNEKRKKRKNLLWAE